MLSKSIVIALPLVLLVLDVFPLRRISWGQWADVRAVLQDKLPYVPIAVLGAVVTLLAGRANGIFTALDSASVPDRIGLVAYSLWFYLSRTVVPIGLSPLHEFPPEVGLFHPPFLASLLVMAIFIAAALRWRVQCPALPVVLIVYALMLAPVSGALHNGYHLVAERYSYLACVPWALLLGGALCVVARARGAGAARRYRLAATATGTWLLILAHATVGQAAVWRDSEALWRATVVADPACALCQHFYARHLRSRGYPERALGHLAQAVALRPSRQGIEDYLAQAALCRHAMGDTEQAREDLEALRRVSPRAAELAGRGMVNDW
jgi:hypothetical protein